MAALNWTQGAMPELFRLRVNGKAKICIYADDHMPPHFHLEHPDWDALIDLKSFKLIEGDAPRREFEEAIKVVKANLAFVLGEWERLNDRDN